MAIEFTDKNFQQEVLHSDQPVLVDFWAPWCPPCRALGPVIDQVADETVDRASVGKLNVDDFQAIAESYGVTSIPTVLVFSNGQVVDTIVGVSDKQTYIDAITAVAA